MRKINLKILTVLTIACSSVFGQTVPNLTVDDSGVIPSNYQYWNVDSFGKCHVGDLGVWTTKTMAQCAADCTVKETAKSGACAGFAFKIKNYSAALGTGNTGDCLLKGTLQYECTRLLPEPNDFDGSVNQVFQYILHKKESELASDFDVNRPRFSFDNFAPKPAATSAVLGSLPAEKTLTYSTVSLGSGITGGVFCKKATLGINTIGTAVFNKLEQDNTNIVRCFAYTSGTTTALGKCYIKDFNQSNVSAAANNPTPSVTVANTTDNTKWVTDSATTSAAMQCSKEGGSVIEAELSLKQAPFANTSIVPKPITSGAIAAANTVVNTLKYGAANISTGTGVTFFCKTTTAAGTPAADFPALSGGTDITKPARCFAYMASTTAAPADVGKCYIKDFKDLASVQAASVVVPNGWVEQPKVATAAESYCATEAGGAVVSTAILPLYLTSNFDPLVATGPTAESKTVKYKTTVLTTVTDGSVFCKSAVAAPSPTGVSLAANAVRCFNFTYGKEGIGGDCYFKDFDVNNYNTPVALSGWAKLASTTDTQPSYCDSEGGSFVVAKTKALPMPVVATTTIAPPPPVVTATPEPTPIVTATPVLQQAVVSPYYYELVFPPKFDQTTGQVIQGAGGAKYERDPSFPDGSFCNRSSPYLRASLKPEDPYYNMTKAKKRTMNFLKKTGPSDEANTHPQDLPISECYDACNKDEQCTYVLYSEKSMKCYMFAQKAASDGAPLTNAGCSPFALTPDPSGAIDINGIKYNKKDYFGKLISPDDAANNPDGYKYYIKRKR